MMNRLNCYSFINGFDITGRHLQDTNSDGMCFALYVDGNN
jgi:hypothetical protein